MAGSSLLTLLDDIASILDDVSVMTKVAAKKTAGVLGDDLALNAEQVSGVRADRELPVVWAVAKGSAKNKIILVPAALLLSAFALAHHALVNARRRFLCYEGFEKVAHKFLHSKAEDEAHHAETLSALRNDDVDIVKFEKEKIKGAIKTDFILSAEIIVIALGTVKDAEFITQVAVVAGIAAIMTVGVYSLVAGIVKLDDAGLALLQAKTADTFGKIKRSMGKGILSVAPYLMKLLSIVGTIAMFIVGGGILVHGIPGSHDVLHHAEEVVRSFPVAGNILAAITLLVINTLVGILLGAIIVGAMSLGRRVFSKNS